MCTAVLRSARWAAGLAGAALILCSAPGMAAEAQQKSDPSEAQLRQKLEDARERLDTAAREVADLSMRLSESIVPQMLAGYAPNRAVLGINLGSRRDDTSEEGVEIVSVSPGGAAAQAGLRAGDVILEVEGKALKRDRTESPRAKLLSALRAVKPGEKVDLSYRRDGKVKRAGVVAQPMADRFFSLKLAPRGYGRVGETIGVLPHLAFKRAEGVFGSAELVPLTPKLGQYFGTDKGLLVVRAPDDGRLKLEDGDVILDIDGRVPSSPTHALRILGSYQTGENLKLNVLRAGKKMSFDITIPEGAWEAYAEDAHSIEFRDSSMPSVPAVPAAPALPGVPQARIGIAPPTDVHGDY